MDALPYYKWNWQDWRASRRVQRMTYVDRGLYRELLDEQWKEGSLPTTMEDLADICGCPVDVMIESWNRLRFHFEESGGRLANATLEKMRTVTDSVRVANARNGHAGAMKKMANAALDEATASERQRPPDGRHIEEKSREDKTREEKSSPRGKREGAKSADPRHASFHAAVMAYGAFHKIKLPWDGSEAKALSLLLASVPEMTLAEFQACLKPPQQVAWTPHGERPRLWLPNITRYQQGPLSQFNRTEEVNGTVRHGQFQTREEKTLSAAQNASRFDQEIADSPRSEPTGDPARDGIRHLLQWAGRVPAGGSGSGDRGTLLEGEARGKNRLSVSANDHRGDSEGGEPSLSAGKTSAGT